jgi:hypothetical protein
VKRERAVQMESAVQMERAEEEESTIWCERAVIAGEHRRT